MDYTPEGIKAHQMDLAVGYLNLIDKKLAKANRRLTVLAVAALAVLYFKVYKKDKETKGE